MTAHARHRVRKFNWPVVGYYFNYYVGFQERTAYVKNESECDDVVGNYPNPNGLSITNYQSTLGKMDGIKFFPDGKTLYKTLSNCPPTHSSPGISLNPAHGLPSLAEQNAAAIQTMAATNPSRPIVSVPTAIGELKDIPGLVRTWGRRLLAFSRSRSFKNEVKRWLAAAPDLDRLRGATAEVYLTNRWVVQPMLSDIDKMLKFAEGVNQRFRMLQRLRDRSSIKGRAAVSNDTQSSTTAGLVIESAYCWIQCNRTTISSRVVWGSCTWKTSTTGPNALNLPTSNEELLALSRRLVSGATSYELIQAAWELLPWSWFIDWFSDIGSTIAAANNTVHATAGQFCVMCKRSAVNCYSIANKDDWVQYVPGREEMSHKWRSPTSITGPVSSSFLPLVEPGKLSVLASLAALRGDSPLRP